MKARWLAPREGRLSHDFMMMLAMMLIVCIAVVRILTPDPASDPRPLWERVVASLVGLFQCFGLCIGASVLIASLEVIKQTAWRYHQRRVKTRQDRLEPLLRDARSQATPGNLARTLRLLRDPDSGVRRSAFAAAYNLLRARPDLAADPASDPRSLWERLSAGLGGAAALGHTAALERVLLGEPGFAQTLATTLADEPLLSRVTLGAKLGAGTADKRLAPPTSDAEELARWVELHRREHDNPEVQISIGYDTGPLPFLAERGRFLALYLFIATTDLKRFQALVRRPPRDPNAAYGLLIRGDVVEVRFPGQSRGHRLDYVFPLPVRLGTANLAALFRDLQLLNLGLLTACVEDACRVLLPGAPPTWLDGHRQAIARPYRLFERRLVAILRRHDRHRDPHRIHPLAPSDHEERVRAFGLYRLEECLYPQYRWVVPLYDPDTRWDQLLAPLRTIEGMILHQGEVVDRDVTRGAAFIHEVRQLGYETAREIEQALASELRASADVAVPPDPFLDPVEDEATRHYLARVGQAIALGPTSAEDVPDPITFRQASVYYRIAPDPLAAQPREIPPEMDR
jgi:hypothetical protein